ncbi:hypothetical protein MPER_05960 [Moniliophthora perniciosa FA553]|nr:hypothetical protein MPER_05960 [Moniliophthora perniciosa FA553]
MYNTVTKKCILNDYDLATLMDPGMELPNRKGYEQTGTRPFMALDLLKADGVTQCRYRYDLESFCWVLVWVGACVQGGQETVPSTYEAMALASHTQVFEKKSTLLLDFASYTTTEDYHDLENIIVDWMMWWCSFRGTMNKAVREQRRHGKPVKEEPAEW